MDLASCRTAGALNFVVAVRFLENLLITRKAFTTKQKNPIFE
jgi:hypothetical protein